MKKACVIGLGYVGLPLACLLARKGFEVSGLEVSDEIVEKTNAGISHIEDEFLAKEVREVKGKLKATTNAAEALKNADVVAVCVPTPVDKQFLPDLEALKSACVSIAENLRKGMLVIIESTIYPGTTEEIAQPILEKSGLKAGVDFFLAHCPERIDPGNRKWRLPQIPRVVGGVNKESVRLAGIFYGQIIDAPVKELRSVRSAEAAKIVENTFRDINIAFVNELAKSFDVLNIDVKEVIEAASTKPFGFMPFYPGPGVGGHCIAVDPYYLIAKAKQSGFDQKFLRLAREINDSMRECVVELAVEGLNALGKSLKDAKIAFLGIAYKPDVDDTRESPALYIIPLLRKKGAVLRIFDPHIEALSNVESLEAALEGADAIIVATSHKEFLQALTPKFVRKKKIGFFLDCRNAFDKVAFKKAGIAFKGIGC